MPDLYQGFIQRGGRPGIFLQPGFPPPHTHTHLDECTTSNVGVALKNYPPAKILCEIFVLGCFCFVILAQLNNLAASFNKFRATYPGVGYFCVVVDKEEVSLHPLAELVTLKTNSKVSFMHIP